MTRRFLVTEQQQEQVLELYKTEKHIGVIAEIVGLDRHAVSQVLKDGDESGYNPRTSRRYTYFYDERYFENIKTEDRAYYFGFLACDGWLKFDKGVFCAVGLEIHEQDAEILERWHNILGPHSPSVKYRATFHKAKLMLHSAQMCADLIDKGFGRNKTFLLGDITCHIPQPLHRHFLRGVLDGDGHWGDSEYRLRFAFRGTNDFLAGLQRIIPIHTVFGGRGKWKSLVSTRHHDAISFGQWLYADTDLYLQRKYIKFISGLERRRSRKTPNIGGSPEEGNPEG